MIPQKVLSIKINKQKITTNFDFELIRFFSLASPIDETEFKKMSPDKLIDFIYKKAYERYEEKMIRNAELAFPVIKQVYENQGDKFERIAVPFTDGQKTLQVVTNLKKAYESDGKQLVTDFEKNITLAIIDEAWKNHLRKMDELKQSVQLAVHEQKDPLVIYKFEAYNLFTIMLDEVNKDVVSFLFKGELPEQNANIREASQTRKRDNVETRKDEIQNLDERAAQSRQAGENASNQRPTSGRNHCQG